MAVCSFLRRFLAHALERLRAARGSSSNRSAGVFTQSRSTSCSTSLSPSPWMSSARREAKCLISSLRCAGQVLPPLQRATACSDSRTTGEPHTGQCVGSSIASCAGDAALGQHPHNLGNDVARAPDHHGIADPHVLARHFVHVMQGGVADRDAAHERRLEARDRRQRAGAAHLKLDAAHRGQRLFGGKLVCDGPARRTRYEAELTLQLEVVDLVHDAVDLVGKAWRAPRRCPGSTRDSPRPIRPRASADRS